MKLLTIPGAAACALLLAANGSAQVVQVDAGIPPYQRTVTVSGNLNAVGSDTMNNMMTLWAEGFAHIHPNVKIQIEGKGSSTAPPALIAGTAQIGPMSREMKDSEIDAVQAKYGFAPTQIVTSIDVLAVYVNKDNPLKSISLAEVDAIFSKTRKRGFKGVETWGQLGLTGDWASRPISLYGRNSASGTYGFFKEHTLLNGDYKDTVKEQPGSASVVQGVASDRFGAGYSGIGYKTSDVKAVPLAEKDGGYYSDGNYEDVKSGKYPLNRFLYIYINRAPGKPLDPLTKEFIKFVLSKEGQEVVVKDGYLPLSTEIVRQELAKIE